MSELKPCPFCGGKPKMFDNDDGANFIECSRCKASSPLKYSLKEDARPILIDDWNARAVDPRVAKLIEAARGIFPLLRPEETFDPVPAYEKLRDALKAFEETI